MYIFCVHRLNVFCAYLTLVCAFAVLNACIYFVVCSLLFYWVVCLLFSSVCVYCGVFVFTVLRACFRLCACVCVICVCRVCLVCRGGRGESGKYSHCAQTKDSTLGSEGRESVVIVIVFPCLGIEQAAAAQRTDGELASLIPEYL